MGDLDRVILRAADDGDLDAVAGVFLSCWRDSYRGSLPRHVISLYDQAKAKALWRETFAKAHDEREVVVAEGTEGRVLGVVVLGLEPDRAGVGHVFSLYVDPQAQGRGIGTQLMAYAVDRFTDRGLAAASLWVFEANRSGRAFYERLGWSADGEVRAEPAYGERELRLWRSLRLGRSTR